MQQSQDREATPVSHEPTQDADEVLIPVSHEPEITIHPSADVLPMMAGDEWEDFKAAILEAGGNLEPVVLHDRQLLDGRNRFRAVQELRAAGHDVELRQKDWQDSGSEGITAFIVRVNLHRRHLTDEQRVAIVVKLQPQIEIESKQRQAATRIQPGEKRNRHGRKGKPELAGADAPPLSLEERRQRNREKESRSTAGQIASRAGVSVNKAKQVIKAVKTSGPEVIDQLVAGSATSKQFVGKKSKRREAPDPQLRTEFRRFVNANYRKLLDEHPAKDRPKVREVLARIIREERAKLGEVRSKTSGKQEKWLAIADVHPVAGAKKAKRQRE